MVVAQESGGLAEAIGEYVRTDGRLHSASPWKAHEATFMRLTSADSRRKQVRSPTALAAGNKARESFSPRPVADKNNRLFSKGKRIACVSEDGIHDVFSAIQEAVRTLWLRP